MEKKRVLSLNSRKIFRLSIAIIIGLIALHMAVIFLSYRFGGGPLNILYGWVNIDGEGNLPTWFSTILLFLVSLSSFAVYHLRQGLPAAQNRWRYFWLGMGGMYVFFSADEATLIHETINRLTQVKWIFSYAPFAGAFFLLCLYYFGIVQQENRTTGKWIIGGLVIYALGGLGFEWIDHTYKAYLVGFWQHVEFMLEEGLELTGTAMVLSGCLHALNELLPGLPPE